MNGLWEVRIEEGPEGRERKGWLRTYLVLAETENHAKALAVREHARGIPELEAKITRVVAEREPDPVVCIRTSRAR